jgi:NAD-dependent dihydropyrimidine dehydrogenase PreA subunit
MHGLFIDVAVAPEIARDPEIAARLAEVCPVDIYAVGDGGEVRVVRENLDECVLCGLCEEAAPRGTVRVIRRYEEMDAA